jgi:biopolymer transport protein ExbB
MTQLIDRWLPWLADLLELGGPILTLILIIAALIWTLLLERLWFLVYQYPTLLRHAQKGWLARKDHRSWYALRQRYGLIMLLKNALGRNYSFVRTLIKVCPLLGLLGTVMGMLEVFDALAATGSNNPRSMAAGVSKATVSTLAGMVVAIVALLGISVIERRALGEQSRLESHFPASID